MPYCGPILKNLFYLGGLDTRTGKNMRRMNVVRTINLSTIRPPPAHPCNVVFKPAKPRVS